MAVRPLRWAAVKASQKFAEAQENSLLRALATPLYGALRGEVTEREVVDMSGALEDAGIRFWLAGGWGVDALVGHQTRRHDDVDIVVDDFANHAGAARAVFESLGFEVRHEMHFALWMPDRWQMADNQLRVVDLLSIDWEKLAAALGVAEGVASEADDKPRNGDDLSCRAFSQGRVGGQDVPCLSVEAQLLYHSGFEPSGAQRHDIALLQRLLGSGERAGPGALEVNGAA
ncbi:MAG: hypothetical protein M0005_15595 [Actinomycetota bacterium]|jgi:lincosamide nucleotidyltransferase A/C/D/E|nr:hypothetical protein [Actinomycetota bacterium]